MATLPGGIQGLYPEALSPEQLEKLRGFKVGAAPTPASIRVQLPWVRAPEKRDVEPVPRQRGGRLGGWGHPRRTPRLLGP